MAFEEDLDEFFDEDEFADSATFMPADGSPSFDVVGIFDAPHLLSRRRDIEVDTSKPTFMTRSAAVAGRVAREDRCRIKGVDYDVLEVQPDGTGVSVVVLSV